MIMTIDDQDACLIFRYLLYNQKIKTISFQENFFWKPLENIPFLLRLRLFRKRWILWLKRSSPNLCIWLNGFQNKLIIGDSFKALEYFDFLETITINKGNNDLGCVTNGTVAPCPSYADRVFLAEKERGRRNNIQLMRLKSG